MFRGFGELLVSVSIFSSKLAKLIVVVVSVFTSYFLLASIVAPRNHCQVRYDSCGLLADEFGFYRSQNLLDFFDYFVVLFKHASNDSLEVIMQGI